MPAISITERSGDPCELDLRCPVMARSGPCPKVVDCPLPVKELTLRGWDILYFVSRGGRGGFFAETRTKTRVQRDKNQKYPVKSVDSGCHLADNESAKYSAPLSVVTRNMLKSIKNWLGPEPGLRWSSDMAIDNRNVGGRNVTFQHIPTIKNAPEKLFRNGLT